MGFGVMCQEIVNRKLCYAEEYMATTINVFTLNPIKKEWVVKETREINFCV